MTNVTKTRKCWEWTGYKKNGRYGSIVMFGKPMQAHVVSYWLFIGEVPKGMKVLHKCDNPACVKPKHLFLGTMKDNTQDMWRKGRGPDRSAIAKKQWLTRKRMYR